MTVAAIISLFILRDITESDQTYSRPTLGPQVAVT